MLYLLFRDMEKEKGNYQAQQAAQTGKFLDAASCIHLRPGKWWGCTLKNVGALGTWKGQQANNQITTLPPLLLSGNSCPLTSVLILYLFLKVCNSTALNRNTIKKDSHTQREPLDTLDIKHFTQRKKYVHEMSLNTPKQRSSVLISWGDRVQGSYDFQGKVMKRRELYTERSP